MSYRDRERSSSRRDSRSPRRDRDRGRESSMDSGRRGPPAAFVQEKNVLQFMKYGAKESPLSDLYAFMQDKTKIKVWTRNFKEVRGILTGYILAFDKHWNLILRDVDEISLVPKKSKTPFLRDVEPNEELPDMPEKVPRKKKDPSENPPPPPPPVKIKKEGEQAKKRRPKNKKKILKRNVDQMFVRGDNIVMLSPFQAESEDEEEDGNESDKAEAEAEASSKE